MDTLDLMENGDIFQQEYEEIKKFSKNYSRVNANKNQNVRKLNSQPSKLVTPSIFISELGTMLDDMKTNLLHSLTI